METEYRQVQGECQELQALLEQRDDQLCTLNQDLLDLTVRMKVCPCHSTLRNAHTAGHRDLSAQDMLA